MRVESVCRGAELVIVEVREEVKMQQKPSKQKNEAGVRDYRKWSCTKKIKKDKHGGV